MSWDVPAWVALACGSGALGGAGGAGMALVVVHLAEGRLVSRFIGGRRRRAQARGRAGQGDGWQGVSDLDRAQIVRDFVAHSTAMNEQVSTYADTLAEGDPVLRERLRRFELGGGQSW